MSSILQELQDKKLISPPAWLSKNVSYLTLMGSHAYGVATEDSDYDVMGFCIPPKADVFPYSELVYYFDSCNVFEEYQKAHIFDKQALGGKGRIYDITIYSIVKYFAMCFKSNPNIFNTLFSSQNNILHATAVSELVRDNRKLFLSKELWPKFKGYTYGQLHKAAGKNPEEGSKRKELRDKFGMDTKYLYNIVRILSECEQILREGDLDLQDKSRREHMKAVRRGEIPESDIREWATAKEKQLEELYHNSKLPDHPDRGQIRSLLLKCLEHHYGSLEKYVQQEDWKISALLEMQKVMSKYEMNLYTL